MFSKITLCRDAESSSVTEFEFHFMWEWFLLSHCLQRLVAVIHLRADLENIVTHGNLVFCSSNYTCKEKLEKTLQISWLFVSHVHNRTNGNTNKITLCSPNSSTCIKPQLLCYQSCLDDTKTFHHYQKWYGCVKYKTARSPFSKISLE